MCYSIEPSRTNSLESFQFSEHQQQYEEELSAIKGSKALVIDHVDPREAYSPTVAYPVST